MRLYLNDQLVADAAGAGDVEGALARFATDKRGSVELRRGPEEYLRATRDGIGAFYLEIFQRGVLFGARQEDPGRAKEAFQEFLGGRTPRLAWKRVPLPPLIEFVFGSATDDNCPLCRWERQGRQN